MASAKKKPGPAAATKKTGANIGFEAALWQAADKLRNNMDAAEYKHVVLGLIFLKYIADAFEEKHAALAANEKSGADPEDADEYRAWTVKESVCAKLRVIVKRILKKYGYPPDKQESATNTVLQQAELLSEAWA